MTEPTEAGRTTESGPPVAHAGSGPHVAYAGAGPPVAYAGAGTARESNARFKRLIADGTTGLSVAFDLPTRMGCDSDTPLASGEVGRAGVAIDSIDDMRVLFAGIPLDTVTTSMAINAPAALLLLLYRLVAEEQGIPATALTGTIRNDVPEEHDARGRYVFPPQPSLRLMADMFRYCRAELPRWTTVSVEGPEPYEPLRAAPGIEERQAERLAKLRAWRCGDRVRRTLAAVTAAAGGDDDLMPPMKEALAAGATVGEVCDALREAWGPSTPVDAHSYRQSDRDSYRESDRRSDTSLDSPIGTPLGTTV